MIRFDNVGMRYEQGDEVLSDISFDLAPGSFHFLTGNSGAGKSSLLRLIYLSQQPSRGLIHIMDEPMNGASRDTRVQMRRRIGVVFQNYRLLDHLTTFDNVALPLRIKGANEDQVQQEVTELLAWVGLANHMHSLPSTLSGGQKQRASIARAVINTPRILLADEPTGNVDGEMAERLMQLFMELNRIGTTMVIATHDPRWVGQYPAPQLHLEAGRMRMIPAAEKAPAIP